MFAPMKRLVVLSLAVAGVGVVGCDDAAEANRAVLDKMADANAKIARLPNLKPIEYKDGSREQTDLQAVRTTLSSAVSENGASPVYTALASSSLGAVDLNAALYARAELITLEQKIRGELALLRQSAQQIALANTLAAGYRAANPQDALANVASQVAAMQGNANVGQWGPGPDPKIINDTRLQVDKTLPTLAAVKQEISRLDGEITRKQQEIADLTKQQSEAAASAETLRQKADTQKGDEAVKTYTEAAQARRKADDILTQIDLAQDALGRLQADLAVQKSQEAVLGEAIAGLQDQARKISAGWEDLQKRAQTQTDLAKQVLDGDREHSIAKRAQKIAGLLADAKTRREDLLSLLEEAEKYFDNASKDASSYSTSIAQLTATPTANAASYRGLRDIIHPQRHKLQKGIAQREGGSIRATEAALAADVENTKKLLAKVLTPASLQMPSELDGLDVGSAKEIAADADARLTTAIATLSEVETGDSVDPKRGVQNSAKTARLIALVGRVQLAQLRAAPPIDDASAMAEIEAIRTDATLLKRDLVQANLPIPPLPGEWGEAPPPAPPAPEADGNAAPAADDANPE